MWFLLAAVFVVIMMFVSRGDWYVGKGEFIQATFIKKITKFFSWALVGAFLLTFIEETIVIVPAGHRGVIFDKLSGIKKESLNEGLNFVIPFIQTVNLFEVRTRKLEWDATAASKDMQSVHTKIALNLRPLPEKVHEIYLTIGTEYDTRVVAPAVQEAVKSVTARYTAEELVTKREDVKRHISELLIHQLKPRHLELEDTFITNFEFGREFSASIEAKQIAEQQALKAKRDLDRIKIEAEQKVAQARAEAESLKMQKEAITPNLIQLRSIEVSAKAVEKWDGKLPEIMMGGSLPFIDMSKFIQAGKRE